MELDEVSFVQDPSALTSEAKLTIFKYELGIIKNQTKRKFAALALTELPEYFWTISASSTGKYHPKHAQGEGGLVRHTQCAVRIAEALFEISNFSENHQDLIIIALLLHDGIKKGLREEKYMRHEHPNLMADFLKDNLMLKEIIDEEELEIIIGAIKTHMGKWVSNNYSKFVLEKPVTNIQKFVHMCDYLASRKFLNMDLT